MVQDKNPDIATKEDLWYIENYLILRDYYDMTISRIAARCIRMGNIALEEYPFYPYILDVLEEICETGEYILSKKPLYPYVEKKIAGGVKALEENLALYQQELENNSSPEMIKQDPQELNKVKEIMSNVDKSVDPTAGAGMNIDDLMTKLLEESKKENPDVVYDTFDETGDKK
ncbi:MAG: hypothetical protein IJ830_05155 [Alphaproteobacteria bacterium]|nr:hypothetical protein [Alphaproteobacteria bacterium]